uniref:Uncharacterized protein n=1 Tax=Streptomyces sp. NBC_00049 TaxID=2903617 RepID=A0AAU2K170_9ACTN
MHCTTGYGPTPLSVGRAGPLGRAHRPRASSAGVRWMDSVSVPWASDPYDLAPAADGRE